MVLGVFCGMRGLYIILRAHFFGCLFGIYGGLSISTNSSGGLRFKDLLRGDFMRTRRTYGAREAYRGRGYELIEVGPFALAGHLFIGELYGAIGGQGTRQVCCTLIGAMFVGGLYHRVELYGRVYIGVQGGVYSIYVVIDCGTSYLGVGLILATGL